MPNPSGNGNNGYDETGDLGGGTPFVLERRDLQKLERLLKMVENGQWVMPPELAAELPADLRKKALGLSTPGTPKPSERTQIMAARILTAMKAANQRDEHKAFDLVASGNVASGTEVRINWVDPPMLEADSP